VYQEQRLESVVILKPHNNPDQNTIPKTTKGRKAMMFCKFLIKKISIVDY
jgi:hypothetical protein